MDSTSGSASATVTSGAPLGRATNTYQAPRRTPPGTVLAHRVDRHAGQASPGLIGPVLVGEAVSPAAVRAATMASRPITRTPGSGRVLPAGQFPHPSGSAGRARI